jgi:hypothetical protein
MTKATTDLLMSNVGHSSHNQLLAIHKNKFKLILEDHGTLDMSDTVVCEFLNGRWVTSVLKRSFTREHDSRDNGLLQCFVT